MRVLIIESEAGWGQKIDEVKEFTGPTAKADAEKFVREFNSQNNKDKVPSIYWYAVLDK